MDCNLTLHGSQSLTHCQPCYKDSLQPEISVKSSSIVKTCSGPSDVCRGGGGGDGDHCPVNMDNVGRFPPVSPLYTNFIDGRLLICVKDETTTDIFRNNQKNFFSDEIF